MDAALVACGGYHGLAALQLAARSCVGKHGAGCLNCAGLLVGIVLEGLLEPLACLINEFRHDVLGHHHQSAALIALPSMGVVPDHPCVRLRNPADVFAEAANQPLTVPGVLRLIGEAVRDSFLGGDVVEFGSLCLGSVLDTHGLEQLLVLFADNLGVVVLVDDILRPSVIVFVKLGHPGFELVAGVHAASLAAESVARTRE